MRTASARPISPTWSRQGAIAGIPWRRQASTAWRRSNCSRTVARLIDRPSAFTVRRRLVNAADGEHVAHAPGGNVGIAEDAGGVGEAEQFGEMDERAGALLAANHDEMVLQAVQIGEEDDPGLVEARRRLEDVAAEGHRRREDLMESGSVAGRELRKAGGGGRRDTVEDAEKRIGIAALVACDELGVV